MNTRTRAPKVILATLCLLIQPPLALAQVPNYIPSNGLVGWWPFNGNANDESGNGHHGVNFGATLTLDRNGNTNSAYSFNGLNNYIEIFFNSSLHNSTGTINAWIKTAGTFNSQKVIFAQSNGRPQLVAASSGINANQTSHFAGIHWKATNGQFPCAQSTSTIDNSQWFMTTGVYSNDSLKIYINGILEGTFPTTLSQDNCSQSNFQIGGFNSSSGCGNITGYSQMFDGIIDDIGLWNRVLSSTEINQIYLSQSCGYGGQIFRSPTGIVCPSDTINIFASGPAGGLIVTDKGNNIGGWRYLETDLTDLSSAAALGCPLGPNSITSNNIGSGFTNSVNIDTDCSDPTFAATLCLNFSKNGYSDWFLPSISTMGLMYQNLHLKGVGGFQNYSGPNWVVQNFNRYWSSSQIGQYGWAFDFGNGTNIPVYNQIVGRNELNRVRPVRFVSGSVRYQWSTGDTTPNISVHPLQTTTYYLTVSQNGQSCYDSITVVVSNIKNTFNPFVSDTVTICDTNVTLNAGPNFTSYSWSNGDLSQTIIVNTPGRYRITITDSNGCSATDSIFVTTSSLNISLSQVQNIKCHGDSTGTIAVAINGGKSPYHVNWSTGATQSQTLASLPAGTYWVEVTDGNGCIRRDTVVLTQPSAPLSGSASATNVLCHGGSSGSITLNIQGGTPPYQFLWSNGAQTPNLINVGAGFYSVLVTDANGCQKQFAAQVLEPLSKLSLALSADSTQCFGSSNGSILAMASGGVSPYTYTWSNGMSTNNINGLQAGIYSVTVTDVNGCTRTATDTVFESASPINVQDSVYHVACYGDSTGHIALIVNGGTSPYHVFWSDGVTGSNRSQIPVGWYHYTVTDALGCVHSDSIQVTQPLAPLSATLTVVNASCFGLSNGTVAVVASGGTAPYSYTWLTNPTKPGNALINVPAGSYPVMIQDANGCQFYVTAVVTQPTPLASAISVQNVACFGQQTGSATVSINGGTPGYMYSWDGAALTSSNFTSGLDTGAHYVLIFDANGCSDSMSFIVNGPLSAITTSPVIANALCFGGTGSISLNATGGSGTLQVTWNTNPLTVGQNLVNQPVGIYSYTILDLNTGCMQNGSLTIGQPALLTATAAATNVLCHGDSSGQIQLTISGGTGPYAVAWNNQLALGINPTSLPAGWYVYTVTDSNTCSLSDSIQIMQPQQPLSLTTGQTSIGCFGDSTGTAWVIPNGGIPPYTYSWIGSNVTNDTLNSVPAGAYTVVVTDSNGCTEQVTINVAQPLAPLNSLTSAQPATCFGDSSGTASVLVIGGTSPYTYLWSDSASSSTSSINQLASGWYFVTITDNAGCSLIDSVFVSQPTSSLTIQGGTNSANCFNTSTGSAWVNASGGTAPYSYLWSTGSMNDSISMVLAGNYVVQVVDANGCSQSTVLTVSQPTALSAITSKQDILCHGDTSGSLNVSPIGGLPPYRILWSTGDTLFALNNLAAGSYSAVITDSLGCSYPISINLSEPNAPLALIGFSIDATCHGAQDGSIQVLASGGVGGYSFTLNSGTSSSSGIFTGLNSGNYSVTVTDANGCTTNQVFVIDEPDSLIYTSIVNDVSCFGSSDGQVKLNITGGTNTYSILWNTGSQGTEVSGLNGGWYVFTVIDGNGCGFVDSVFVNEPSGLLMSITATNPECVNSFDGKLLISSSGGTGNHIYLVNGSSSSGTEEDLGPGEFIVTVTDDNGCAVSQTVVLTESRNPCVEIPNWFSPDGNGQNETWVIPGFEFGSYQLFVVNVWGQKVYETRSENYSPWDGTFNGEPLPNGDYYYVVSSSDSSEPTFTGYVTILR